MTMTTTHSRWIRIFGIRITYYRRRRNVRSTWTSA